MRRVFIGLAVATSCVWLLAAAPVAGAKGRVLRVGTYHGIRGQYKSIQAAVNHAKPGAFILIAPGDYKTRSWKFPKGSGHNYPAGVLIQTRDLTLRGMNRNSVIVDGTKKHSARCSDKQSAQNFGPKASGGQTGLNGIEVWKAANVSVENVTACNFLGGAGGDGGTGNEIWWNGGINSSQLGGWHYYGSYLTATTTWYDTKVSPEQAEVSAAEYGIFSSNWDGGEWNHTYASNMNDSGYYIGACQDECNQVVNHAWAEWNALGYSGSNSGGNLVVKNSQFDNNEDGFDTNSQNGDEPSPQNGECPNNGINPITHTHSCWVFMDNYVHNNNDPSVPTAGFAAAGPVGTGMSLSGARNDTVMDNRFENNGAWGNIVVPFPDQGPPCTGGTGGENASAVCLYDEYGDAVIDNHYKNNGFFGNPTNGDFEQSNLEPDEPTDCFSANTEIGGGSISPDSQQLEQEYPTCGGTAYVPNTTPEFTDEVGCDSGISLASGESAPCPPGSSYPRFNSADIHDGLHKLPPKRELKSMPHPCRGVPRNPWCPAPTKKK
jgi:hypothetical protein